MIILGIETSCDETAVSIIRAEGGINDLHFEALGSAVNSQIKIHEEFGGVVPNLAKREHQKNLLPVLVEAFKKTDIKDELWEMDYELWEEKNPDKKFPIDLITVTVGPGLEPALWVGIEFAKNLSKQWNIPVIGANHMVGHMASVLFKNDKVEFPALALLISGGHTELVLLNNWLERKKLGETLDDAVGEAFDKVARMLGLPYPGGPEISRLAQEAREKNVSLDKKFPRPMIHSKDFNFSFSGLKTAVLYYLRSLRNSSVNEPCERDGASTRKNSAEFYPCERTEAISQAVSREFEDAVIETLLSKTKKAIDEYLPKTLIIGGGVIANKALRENFLKLSETYSDLKIFIPEKSLTTDNATMIAAAGYIEYLKNGNNERELEAEGNLDII
jgi:N6-L-threonylcarbamoyladenine synthase